MERMWRKVNQGLNSLSKNAHSTDTASSAGFNEGPKVVAVSNRSHHIPGMVTTSTKAVSRRSNHQSSTMTMGSTASSERRRRRRKRSRPRREGFV